jgi:hypothetical protein
VGAWLASAAIATTVLAREPRSVVVRLLMVVIAVAGFSLWLWTGIVSIKSRDEFTRHLHLVALSVAFALTGLFVIAAVFLERARLVDRVPLDWMLVWMVSAWALSIFLTPRFYR